MEKINPKLDELIRFIDKGYTVKQIAMRMDVCDHTIRRWKSLIPREKVLLLKENGASRKKRAQSWGNRGNTPLDI